MFFEEIQEEETYVASGEKIITGTEIDLVAQMAGMDLPGFLDHKAAETWGFKDRVAPGAYVIACMFGLMAKQGFLSNAVWTKSTELVFSAPVLPLDRLRAKAKVIAKKESRRGGGMVTYQWTVWNQREETVATGTNL